MKGQRVEILTTIDGNKAFFPELGIAIGVLDKKATLFCPKHTCCCCCDDSVEVASLTFYILSGKKMPQEGSSTDVCFHLLLSSRPSVSVRSRVGRQRTHVCARSQAPALVRATPNLSYTILSLREILYISIHVMRCIPYGNARKNYSYWFLGQTHTVYSL